MKKFLLGLCVLCAATSAYAQEEGLLTSIVTDPVNSSKGVSAYNATYTLTNDADETWTVYGFNNNNNDATWSFIRTGSKNFTMTGTITTDEAISGSVDQVKLYILTTQAAKVSAAKILVSENADMSNPTSYEFTIPAGTAKAKPTTPVTVEITDPQANMYYQLAVICDKGSSNGFVEIYSISYYGTNGDGPVLQAAGLSYDNAAVTAALNVDFVSPVLNNPNELDVVYSSSDEAVATVDEKGVVTLLAAGSTTIKAVSEANDEFRAGSASYTLTVVESAYKSIAEIVENAPENGDEFAMAGEVTVVYVNGLYCYIKDETGSTLIYGNTDYKKGDVVSGVWGGTVSIYNGLYELKPTSLPAASEIAIVTYPEVTTITEDMVNEVVILKNAEVSVAAEAGQNGMIYLGEGEDAEAFTLRNTFKLDEAPTGVFDILGAVSVYVDKTGYKDLQFLPIEYITTSQSGIATIESNEKVAYYNMQGVRISEPAKGMYIRVANGKAVKIAK